MKKPLTFASLLLPFPLEKKGYGTFLKLVGSFWDLELRQAQHLIPHPHQVSRPFVIPGGCAKGIMPCILGREAYLDFYVEGSASCSKILVVGQIKWVPLKHKMCGGTPSPIQPFVSMCSSECGYNKKFIYFKTIHIKSKHNKLKLKTYTITIINEKIFYNFIIKGITL